MIAPRTTTEATSSSVAVELVVGGRMRLGSGRGSIASKCSEKWRGSSASASLNGVSALDQRRSARDAARNRARILAAARELFAERGLEVTMDEIARHAGVGVGTVYRRFRQRSELIEALFEQRIDDSSRSPSARWPIRTRGTGSSSSSSRAWRCRRPTAA